jgi:DNA-binding MltR family transcriptional regulator
MHNDKLRSSWNQLKEHHACTGFSDDEILDIIEYRRPVLRFSSERILRNTAIFSFIIAFL